MKKILLIDDNVELCNELADILRQEGYRVDNSSDSEQGASFIKMNRYDIGLFDYKMLGLNGIDLLKLIKGENKDCYVFIISGMLSLQRLIQEAHAETLMVDIIQKPFRIETLLRKVSEVSK